MLPSHIDPYLDVDYNSVLVPKISFRSVCSIFFILTEKQSWLIT